MLLLTAAVAALAVAAAAPGCSWYGAVLTHGPGGERVVALTFDDGPSDATPAILDQLEALDVHATFFVVGENARRYPELVRRELADGDVVGTHTLDHDRWQALFDFRYRDVAAGIDALRAATGHAPALFRVPYGFHTPWSMAAVRSHGLRVVGWSIDPADWRAGATATQIADRVVSQARPGGIVLLHDGNTDRAHADRAATAAALPLIVQRLRAQGYHFVTVDQLLGVPAYR